MKIKIDLELLNAQIQECDIKADNASTEEERGIFDGIADLLRDIAYGVEIDDEIYFESEVK